MRGCNLIVVNLLLVNNFVIYLFDGTKTICNPSVGRGKKLFTPRCSPIVVMQQGWLAIKCRIETKQKVRIVKLLPGACIVNPGIATF